jgi:hypothetical protein
MVSEDDDLAVSARYSSRAAALACSYRGLLCQNNTASRSCCVPQNMQFKVLLMLQTQLNMHAGQRQAITVASPLLLSVHYFQGGYMLPTALPLAMQYA